MELELERIKARVAIFKTENEARLLDLSRDGLVSPGLGPLSDISEAVDTEVLLVPVETVCTHSWPRALVGNAADRCIEMGTMEAHGSLWRLVRNGTSAGMLRVLLQTAEYGEDSLFLSAELELVTEREGAALWVVKAVPAKGLLSSAYRGASEQGVLVQLELHDAAIGAGSGRLLSSGSCDRGRAGLGLMTAAQRQVGDIKWSVTFEVIREDTPVSGLEALGDALRED